MLVALGPKGPRAWDLLERVAQNTLALNALYDAYANNAPGPPRAVRMSGP